MYKLLAFATLACVAIAIAEAQRAIHPTFRPDQGRPPVIHPTYRPDQGRPLIIHPTYRVPQTSPKIYRIRRFTGLNANPTNQQQNNPNSPVKSGGWEVSPQVNRDDRGNVRGSVDVRNHGKDHDFEAGWEQNVRGPNKHSETWRAKGTYRFPN